MEHVDGKLYRTESSSERDLNQLELWKKDIRHHASKMSFDGNMAVKFKVSDLKKDCNSWYVSYVLYSSILMQIFLRD